ncbi:HNH endonuclease [Rhodococcus opacus]|uniref:HNH endonuclease n=1 Tax=Rhodococcus opacus TaxID=37919 RepID=UPI000EAA2E27|nr:HNH endonuclease [Rhodococcus opacus]QZS57566.1 HNH endonuclease [Rhodococcus opacus]RKM75820.1 endonuclease [Rhodococcus opacus]
MRHFSRNPPGSTLDARSWSRANVLVLNVTYEALCEIPAERAVVLISVGAAETVADREPPFPIRSQHVEISLPQTIRLLRYVYVPHSVLVTDSSRATFAGVFRRDRNRCGYCAEPVATTIDHVLPRSRGGPNTWANLVACCVPCNQRKADRTPEEAGMPLLWEPKAPRHIEKAQRQIWRDLAAV